MVFQYEEVRDHILFPQKQARKAKREGVRHTLLYERQNSELWGRCHKQVVYKAKNNMQALVLARYC